MYSSNCKLYPLIRIGVFVLADVGGPTSSRGGSGSPTGPGATGSEPGSDRPQGRQRKDDQAVNKSSSGGKGHSPRNSETAGSGSGPGSSRIPTATARGPGDVFNGESSLDGRTGRDICIHLTFDFVLLSFLHSLGDSALNFK